LFCTGYLGNTILRTLIGRADRTNFDISIGVRDEATANKFRKDGVKVRIIDLDDSSALEQAAEESDGQLTSLNRWVHVPDAWFQWFSRPRLPTTSGQSMP